MVGRPPASPNAEATNGTWCGKADSKGREKRIIPLAEVILPDLKGLRFREGISSAVGEQFMPAKGFSGFTRGEQRCASGGLLPPPACEPVGGWSLSTFDRD